MAGLRLIVFAIPLLAAAQEGAVEGLAFNKLTKAPVPGVKVIIAVRGEPGNYQEAVTGIDGKYRVDNLPPGEYLPNVNAPRGMFGPSPVDFAFKPIKISDKVVQLDIPITPASIARGRVLDPDRKPVAGARLIAVPVGGLQSAMGITDADGRFSMSLAPGQYRIRVQPSSKDWAPTWYPNATAPASAEVVTVAEGAGVDGVDIRLRPHSANRLSGIVRDDAHKPVPGVELSIHEDDAFVSTATKVRSDDKGAFTFTSVPPGQWHISAIASIDGIGWMGEAPVLMPDRDLDTVVVRIDPPFSYEARVEGLPDGRSMPLTIELRRTSGVGQTPAVRERDGLVRIPRVYPSTYRIGVFGPVPGRYLKSISMDNVDVTGRPVDLGPASPPLRIVFVPNPARVTGEVENGAGARVALVWADRDNYVSGIDVIVMTCDDAGRFTIPNLRPGAWYALALPPAPGFFQAAPIRDRVFKQGLWREAAAVRVAEGETADVKLKILP